MALLLGFVGSSSTAIGIKMLEETGELKTRTGLLCIGILIAQDLAFVPMLCWYWALFPSARLTIGGCSCCWDLSSCWAGSYGIWPRAAVSKYPF